MRQYTSEEIQAQFDKLPAEVQQAVTSTEVHDRIEGIGKKYGLMIDQLGELVDEIGLVLLGLHRSADFVSQISQRMGISSKAATTIAQDVNNEVFGSIKDYLRKMEDEAEEQRTEEVSKENRTSTVSTLERVGGFEVDKPSVETESNSVTSADKASILAGVEDPEPTAPAMTPQKNSATPHSAPAPTNLPTGTPTWSEGKKPAPSPAKITKDEQHTEPIVDFLLGNAAAAPAQKVVSAPPPSKPTTPTAPPVPTSPKKSGPDPYREPIQ